MKKSVPVRSLLVPVELFEPLVSQNKPYNHRLSDKQNEVFKGSDCMTLSAILVLSECSVPMSLFSVHKMRKI